MNETTQEEARYSIGAVARLTGLTTHTIRMWEHRYEAVVAARQDNGRRIYTPENVEKLSLLKSLTDSGVAISHVANLDMQALYTRLEDDAGIRSRTHKGPVRVAVMGSSLATQISELSLQTDDIQLIASAAEPRKLSSALRKRKPDLLIIELPVVGTHELKLIASLIERHQPGSTLVVYRFAKSKVIKSLFDSGISPARSPLSSEELGIITLGIEAAPQGRERSEHNPSLSILEGDIPDKLYSDQQLASLLRADSSIDCECPRHLSELITGLGAFEAYSRDCEDSDPQQAQLHDRLHRSTAQARGLMEQALQRLAEVDNLKI